MSLTVDDHLYGSKQIPFDISTRTNVDAWAGFQWDDATYDAWVTDIELVRTDTPWCDDSSSRKRRSVVSPYNDQCIAECEETLFSHPGTAIAPNSQIGTATSTGRF